MVFSRSTNTSIITSRYIETKNKVLQEPHKMKTKNDIVDEILSCDFFGVILVSFDERIIIFVYGSSFA